MDRLKQLRNRHGLGDNIEEMMKNRPMFGDRMARSAEDIRSRLDEARRVNVEELRQLQRCVCVCVCVLERIRVV